MNQIKGIVAGFLEAIEGLASSKKVVTAMSGIAVVVLGKHYGLSDEDAANIVKMVLALLVGQAATDFGKAGKAIDADAMAENQPGE